MANAPRSPEDAAVRTRELLLALYRHPLTAEQILRLNPTFTFPFPVHLVRRRTTDGVRVYREARTLGRLLADLAADGRVAQADYAIAGRGCRPYYLLTEAGFANLFPDTPVPKKTSIQATTQRTRTRSSAFFRPIPLGTQAHDIAVGETVVHTLIQAKRDGIAVTSCHTRHRVELEIPIAHALATDLKKYARLDRTTGAPLAQSLSLFPDATFEFETAAGRYLRFDEIDGGSESVLSREDHDAIERKVRFYDHYADCARRRFRVRFLTCKSNSFGRLMSVMQSVRSVLRNPRRPLFLFGTLERYLSTNGALTRPMFLDHFGRPVACIPAHAVEPSPLRVAAHDRYADFPARQSTRLGPSPMAQTHSDCAPAHQDADLAILVAAAPTVEITADAISLSTAKG